MPKAYLWSRQKVHGLGVTVIATAEVTVEGGHDGIVLGLGFINIDTLPLDIKSAYPFIHTI